MAESFDFNKEPFKLGAIEHIYHGAQSPEGTLRSAPNGVVGKTPGGVQITLFLRLEDGELFSRMYHVPSGTVAWYATRDTGE